MLYKVSTKDVREDNNNIDATPAFTVLTSKQLKYIFLTYDFDTPLRQLSLVDRKEQAAQNAGYAREDATRMGKAARSIMAGKDKKVEVGIIAFKRQLVDLDREALVAYDSNLRDYIDKMKQPKLSKEDWDLNLKIVANYEKLLIARKKIVEQLNLRADDFIMEEVTDQELSTLDMVNEKLINQE